jgi:lysophospholipid acyltransferase
MSYIYFCGAVISGPWYEFRDFDSMIKLEGEFKVIPSTTWPAVRRYFEAWLCVAVGSFFDNFFPHEFLLTDEFASHSLLWQIGYTFGSLKNMMYRTYMVGWCLMEIGPIASGLSFNGLDENGQPKWDRVKSCNIYKLETSWKVKDFLANWNMSAHNWLKHYVYLRQLDNKKKESFNFQSTFLTFIMSAIWHGFYPGYYVFFTGAGLMDYH